jgi:hypothetical protein
MYNISEAVSPAAANVATDALLKKGSGVFVLTDFVGWNRLIVLERISVIYRDCTFMPRELS